LVLHSNEKAACAADWGLTSEVLDGLKDKKRKT